jgi:hypothetical protein
MNDINWVSIEETTNIVIDHLIELAFEILMISKFLPFIMPIYKLHKKTYMGITSAQGLFLHIGTHSHNNINEVLTLIQGTGQNKNRWI